MIALDLRPLVLLDEEHGTMDGYWKGCRCISCKRANADRAASYRKGVPPRLGKGRPNTRAPEPDRGWMEHAACRGMNPDIFFTVRDEVRNPTVYDEARRICAACPVLRTCREYALTTGEQAGMWGAMSPKQRVAERLRRRKAAGGDE